MKRTSLLFTFCLAAIAMMANPKNFDKVQQKAWQGNSKACFQLAEFYHNGTDGLQVNLDSAAHYYVKASADNPKAVGLAGMVYRELFKQTKDTTQLNLSIKYLEKHLTGSNKQSTSAPISFRDIWNDASGKTPTNPNALYELLLAEDYFDSKSWDNAKAMYKKNPTDALSMIRLETYNPTSNEKPENYLKALGLTSVNTIDIDDAFAYAKNRIPLVYMLHDDVNNAIKYHKQFTGDNDVQTYSWIGSFYYVNRDSGKYFSYNYSTNDLINKSLQYYQKAIDAGDRTANYQIAKMYHDSKNYKAALPYALEAIKINDGKDENYILASCYFFTDKKEEAFPYWKKAAEMGHTIACVRLGQYYLNGTGCTKDNELAIKYYELGLQDNNIGWAQYDLGKLYQDEAWNMLVQSITGNEGEENTYEYDSDKRKLYLQKAQYWYEKAADNRNWDGKIALAELIKDSDKTKAKALADDCWQHGYFHKRAWLVCNHILADSIYNEIITNNDLRKLREWRTFFATNGAIDFKNSKLLADNGDAEECHILGKSYSTGIFNWTNYVKETDEYKVDVDSALAFSYFSKAHELAPNNKEYTKSFLSCYTYGIGVKKDIDKARAIAKACDYDYIGYFYFEWYSHQIEKGDYDAVIQMFEEGNVPNLYLTFNTSLSWLKKAATNGTEKQKAEACYVLGECYEHGKYDIPVDYAKAITYYKQAANFNSSSACYHLGWIYRTAALNQKMNLSVASQYYHKCYKLSGNQDAYYYYLHCLNRTL